MKSSLEPETREELENANWQEIWPRLLKHSRCKAWKAKQIGRNLDPEYLVHEAVSLAFGARDDGRFRHWNKLKYPNLLDFMKSIIDSEAYHAIGKDQRKKQEYWDPEVEKPLEVGHREIMANYTAIGLSPEEALEHEENFWSLMTKLEDTLAKDDEAQYVLLAMRDGATEPKVISEKTGISVSRVYKLRDKIRKIVLNAGAHRFRNNVAN